MKDMDDFILMLIRNPEFPKVVNDIVVECGNALYQPILDRYIAGEDVPFSEARQAWRNSTGIMCDVSGFFEQLFPLVRRINQRLLPTKRLRVVAAGPPVDWNAIKKESDVTPFLGQSLDENYAAVMEREVFAKQRKALMLFGNGHLSHGVEMPPAALADFAIPQGTVARYERSHPGVTFVIDQFDARPGPCGTPGSMDSTEFQVKMQAWPVPSLVRTKGTSLPGATIALGGKVTVLIDAFLYLGPRDLALAEPSPADIFLDTEFMAEVHRRAALTGWLTKKQETPLAIPWSIDPDEVHEESASPFILCRQR
jgi:hypothetical protein